MQAGGQAGRREGRGPARARAGGGAVHRGARDADVPQPGRRAAAGGAGREGGEGKGGSLSGWWWWCVCGGGGGGGAAQRGGATLCCGALKRQRRWPAQEARVREKRAHTSARVHEARCARRRQGDKGAGSTDPCLLPLRRPWSRSASSRLWRSSCTPHRTRTSALRLSRRSHSSPPTRR